MPSLFLDPYVLKPMQYQGLRGLGVLVILRLFLRLIRRFSLAPYP
jgi:hypothetical protein